MNSVVRRVFGVTSVVFMSSISFGYSGGSGTVDAPYQIADANDLLELAADTGNYDKYFILTADIDLAGHGFTMALIAPNTEDNTTAFTGTFNGNNHVISNLMVDTQGQSQSYLGLFGNISSTVKQLGLENVSVTCGDTSAYVGTLAGLNQGTIDQCYVKGAIHGGVSPQNLGGLVGVSAGTITNCYAEVDVYAGESAQILGGFAGTAYGIFSNCYAIGFVDSRSSAGGFGGAVHPWFSILYNCYSLASGDGGGPDNGIGTVLTDTQMRQQSSFVNWDFQGNAADGEDEIWQITGGYPVLAWQVPVGMRQLAVLSRYWQATGCVSGQPCVIADWYDDDIIDANDLALLVESWLGHGMKTDYPKTMDDFETGDFTKLSWVQGGAADWTIISGSDVYEGLYSAKSGNIGNSQSSTLTLTAELSEDSEIIFAVRVSSESGFDKLVLYIDDSYRASWTGAVNWQEVSLNGFGAGTHTFEWAYEKDSSGSGGSDCAWIDDVRILRLEE